MDKSKKMSVSAAEDLFKAEVIAAVGDKGTKVFLSLMKDFVDGFSESGVGMEERVYKVRFCLSFLIF